MKRTWMWALLLTTGSAGLCAQNIEQALKERLVGEPLYLRGQWKGQSLEFDGQGRMVGSAVAGSLTLSGVDVRDVMVRGDQMQIHADRVGLVADADGRLQRRGLSTTTGMFWTYQKKFVAKEEIKITIHADATGSFDVPLKVIFANGLADLAASVPSYWSCYAKAYFAIDLPTQEAATMTDTCARRQGAARTVDLDGEETEDGVMPPKLVKRSGSAALPPLPQEAYELHLSGTVRVHFTIGPHGVPLRFQIVQALGGGADEVVLQFLSTSQFEPTTRNGVAVPMDVETDIKF